MPPPAGFNDFDNKFQPLEDNVYGVTIVTGNGKVIPSYTVTVFGVDGLAFGPYSNIGRQITPTIWGPNPAPQAARAGAAAGPDVVLDVPDSPQPAFGAAPLMPEGWGQAK
jgi:hypothetical protein